MATAKSAKIKPKSGKKGGSGPMLRTSAEHRRERRFAPKLSGGALLSVLVASLGFVAAGAGVFGQFLREGGPHPYAIYLLIGGGVVAVAGVMLGQKPAQPVRAGDAGVAVENADGSVTRLGWHELDRVRLEKGVLLFAGSAGKNVAIDTTVFPDAGSVALEELRKRRADLATDITEKIEPSGAIAASWVDVEPLQLAGERCKASGKVISLEKDGRSCARCGEVYHRESVPERCLTCDVAF